MKNTHAFERNRKYTLIDGESGFSLNVSGMNFSDKDLESMSARFKEADMEMRRIESGEIKNPDENRKVTHFSDRAVYPETSLYMDVEAFVESIRLGAITGSTGKKFDSAVINGIGGSVLGPELVQFAINGPCWNELPEEKRAGYLKIYFVDNTDSAGIADISSVVDLERTLILSISKSGGTQETKNNITAFSKVFEDVGLNFAKHSCAITMPGSELDSLVSSENWLKVFPMAESIGGRTSETSIVGHLPAALAGVNFRELLGGACHMDAWTRNPELQKNPAYLLAAMWYLAGNGHGDRNMIIVPYSDRLIMLSRYLQQLVMESLGKEKDLDGKIVHQGLNVFGNKGGTDAHAFIQQLNDGRDDFFVTFIEVWRDMLNIPLSNGIFMGDYLHGFQAGLKKALIEKKRKVIEISIRKVDSFNIGMLIALYERAVAVYAELAHINAFHQPGVQAYKLASKEIINLICRLEKELGKLSGYEGTALQLAEKLGMTKDELEIEGVLAKFAENPDRIYQGFKISRGWDKYKGWIYRIKLIKN